MRPNRNGLTVKKNPDVPTKKVSFGGFLTFFFFFGFGPTNVTGMVLSRPEKHKIKHTDEFGINWDGLE